MADINLTQTEADALIAMEKYRMNEESHSFPAEGQSLVLPLQSKDRREQFFLDLSRGRIDLSKVKMQNRGRQVIVLVRIDLGGPPHRNPDGEEISSPHLHVYREGYSDKWATPLPNEQINVADDLWKILDAFLRFCNVTKPPTIERGLFL